MGCGGRIRYGLLWNRFLIRSYVDRFLRVILIGKFVEKVQIFDWHKVFSDFSFAHMGRERRTGKEALCEKLRILNKFVMFDCVGPQRQDTCACADSRAKN